MIFLTLGTYPLQFNRLIKAIDDMAKEELKGEDIFAQIGFSDYEPKNIPFKRVMEKQEFDACFRKSTTLISHAGMGSIIMALDLNKPLLIMPRLKKYGEHVNDHQLGTAKTFEKLGHVLAVYDENHLAQKITGLKTFRPSPRENEAKKVAARIKDFLGSL